MNKKKPDADTAEAEEASVQENADRNENTFWHSGFVGAMDLELAKNRDDIICEDEHTLNKQPLRIDLLIIMKEADTVIENEIGAFFRGINLLEYKNPRDDLSIDDVYKVMAYACLYKAYGEKVDSVKADDMTVSLIRRGRPEHLFKYFEEHKDEVVHTHRGIYQISGSYPFPMQIIVTKEFAEGEHIWLQSLSNQLNEDELKRLIMEINKLTDKQDLQSAEAVLDVSINANKKIVEQLRGDESMSKALMEIMEPEIRLREKEAADKALNEGRTEGIHGAVIILRDFGLPENEIAEKITRQYGLSFDEAKSFL